MFDDRRAAGKELAQKLQEYKNQEDVIVLGLPRGGVPVAFEVATELNVPLDVYIVQKLGSPNNSELAMGAIASGGIKVFNQDIIEEMEISDQVIQHAVEQEKEELKRREKLFRGVHRSLDLKNKTVIIVDDGIATGATMNAAVTAIKEAKPQKIVIAVPTAPPKVCSKFKSKVDAVICLITPKFFGGVGRWYREFSQTTTEEVQHFLQKAQHGA